MGNAWSGFPKVKRVRPSMIWDAKGVMADPAHLPGWLSNSEVMMERLRRDVPWALNPRASFSWYEKLPQSAYYYGCDEMWKKPCAVLNELVGRVESEFQCNVFAVWCNLLKDGGNHIDWHQDKWGTDCITLSFGTPRRFVMREKRSKETIADFLLRSGDLYFFSEAANQKTEHCVPKDDACTDPRISLLFFIDYPYSRLDGWLYDATTHKYEQHRTW
eukprot:TRINITY_DN398_c0_g1_i8.p1 TRINITY_DN398_c0_g1~~TRINITY_DN398_c0_g1_i8.p1  ORF type:complete len:217 (+),score=77.46 TRINITY_DN398_c0_g1_i8:49-699(+)